MEKPLFFAVENGKRKVSFNELTDGDGALLAVNDLEVATLPDGPIHDIQWEVLDDGDDDRIPLLVFVDELPLIGGTDVQLVAIADHPGFPVVLVAIRQFTNCDFFQFDFHDYLYFLSIKILL